MPSTTYEGEDFTYHLEFTIEPASGDGWDEPRVPRHASIHKVSIPLKSSIHSQKKDSLFEIPFWYIPDKLFSYFQDVADEACFED